MSSPAQLLKAWRPMLHESGISAEMLTGGLAQLRSATYAEQRRYYAAFFSLSIGLERLMKLIILLDRLQEHGSFPTTVEFKHQYGHNLLQLFTACEVVRQRLPPEDLQWTLPSRPIVNEIMTILAEFAKSTRYYNLDILTGDSEGSDPIEKWARRVAPPILADKYPASPGLSVGG